MWKIRSALKNYCFRIEKDLMNFSQYTSEKLVIVTAPSGAGKTTIVKHLLTEYPYFEFSVSACTRPQRPGEVHGLDYYFMSIEEFKKKVDTDEFVEWEEVYKDSFYGTLKDEIRRIWSQNHVALFDVDVKGAISIQKAFPKESISIFVKPPSLDTLAQRLKNRATEDLQKIEERIAKATSEMEYEDYFDETVVNENLRDTLVKMEEIVDKFLKA